MAILVKGTDFTTGDQVTAANLDNLVDAATFASGAVDNSTTQLSGGAIIVKDAGITMAKLASASNGYVPIGNGGGFTAAALTAGTNIGITNGSGSVSIAFSGTLPIANGGTGAVTAAAARTALGIVNPVTNTAQLDRTDTTYTDIPGLSVNLVSGTTYTVDMIVPCSTTAVSGVRFKLAGTATASSANGVGTIYHVSGLQVGLITSITGAVTSNPGFIITDGMFQATVTIVCNGSGTLKLQFAEQTATGTASALLGAWMKSTSY